MLLARPWARVAAYWLQAYRRTWVGSAFADFLAPVLFLAGLGFGLGALVDAGAGGPGGAPGGVGYAGFVAPGVLAGQAMLTGVAESTYPVMGAVKWNRAYHAMLATPVTTRDVVTGHLAYVALRLLAATSVFLAVAAALGAVRGAGAVLAVPVAVLVGMSFAAPAFALAARTDTDQTFALLTRFVITPLFLFSGTFFPLQDLPAPLQWVGWATPLWHGVEACPALAVGTAQLLPVLGHLLVPAAYLAAGVALAHRALGARMVR